jgi:hypothetical protein
MGKPRDAEKVEAEEESKDPPSGFGEVLFDELKQVAIRRGGLAFLAGARERRRNATDEHGRKVNGSEIAEQLPIAAGAVRHLADIVLSHTKALRQVAKCARKRHPEAARSILRELALVVRCVREAVAAIGASAAVNDGEQPDPGAEGGTKILRSYRSYRRILRADKKCEALSERLRQIQSDPERLEADEMIADEARKSALDLDLVGLAFSGGGIRSATFNLGILQGLASFRLLGAFDYLSTVSGGGYIGGWLAAWIHHEKDIDNVQKQLHPKRIDQAEAMRGWPDWDRGNEELGTKKVEQDGESPNGRARLVRGVVEEEPEPIYHLRRYSNYLTPTTGLLSIDTWSMLSTYGRNFLLNQLILLPAAMALILFPRLVLWSFHLQQVASWRRLSLGVAMFLFAAAALIAMYSFLLVRRLAHSAPSGSHPTSTEIFLAKQARPELSWFRRYVVLPLIAAAILFSFLFSRPGSPFLDIPIPEWVVHLSACLTGYVPLAFAFGLFAGTFRLAVFLAIWLPWLIGMIWSRWRLRRSAADSGDADADPARARREETKVPSGDVGPMEFARRGMSSFLAAFTSATCLYATFSWFRALLSGAEGLLAPTMATFGPPAAILAIALSTAIESGLLGALEEEEIREWRASLGAYLLRVAAAWAIIFGISLYGPLLIAAVGPLRSAALGTGWLATSITGVLAGRGAKTRGGRDNAWEYLALFAPPVFVVGLLVLVAILDCLLLGVVPPLGFEHRSTRHFLEEMGNVTWLPTFLIVLAIAIIISLLVNVNLFSLHAFYANRLVRCYLGASRREGTRPPGRPHFAPSNCPAPARHPNPITGFDRDDDFPLKELKAFSQEVGMHGSGGLARGYQGPFPLIHAALSLVSGKELAWQERMAESFVLSPLYSGSKSTGYRKMDATRPEAGGGRQPGYGDDLGLGTAVSISGAAASPNMGYHSSLAVTFLMTVFNARLGWWLGNPGGNRWRDPGPRTGFYLFMELLGLTDATRPYVYLSDGGHFENLGVYELVRRRCRYIVVCDAGEDPSLAFWDLGSLVRKCREDLGVRIEIDIAPLLRQETWGRSRWHCSIGKIRYDDIDVSAIPGVLLYIKPSLTGDEPTDIRNYVVDHPRFPHEPTSNQFFSESQFESYRALGEHVAREVFRDAAGKGGGGRAGELFSALHRRWFPPPPDFDAHFLKSVDAYIAMQGQLRTDPNLSRLSDELYPETRSDADGYGAQDRAEVHAIGQVLQVMENVWLTVGLDSFAEHPMNRGWMNWFRRWSGSEVFQKHWPALRGEFSQDFVRFAERQLNLRVAPPGLIGYPPIGTDDPPFHAAIRRLDAEYVLEWSTRPWPGGEKYRPVGDHNGTGGRPEVNRGGIIELVAYAAEHAKDMFPDGKVPVWVIREPTLPGVAVDQPPWNGRGCGVILAWKTRDDDVKRDVIELFVWLRGPYRTLGIGRSCVEGAIGEIRRQLDPGGRKFTVRVDYPMRDVSATNGHRQGGVSGTDASGSEDRWQSMVWLSFFEGLGFRKKQQETPGQEVLSLYRSERGTSDRGRPAIPRRPGEEAGAAGGNGTRGLGARWLDPSGSANSTGT